MSMTLLTSTIQTLRVNRRIRRRLSSENNPDTSLSDTEKSIIKTLVYYHVLGQYPLTALELYRYLQKENDEQILPSFYSFLRLLEKSSAINKVLERKNGFYFLKNNQSFYHQRIFRQKIAIAKWKRTRKIAVFLAVCPFLRGLMVSGSLAFGNTKTQSDIDLLIITEKGRIWTCRTFLSFLLQIIGQRRHDQVIENKVCLNHYIARDSLAVPLQNLSNAHLYSHLIPLLNYQNFRLFQEQNSWIGRLIFSYPQTKQNYLRQINEGSVIFRLASFLGRGLEILLAGFPGRLLEKKLAAWQTKRIHQKTNWRELKSEQLHLDDNSLLFHYPLCRNTEVMNKYRQKAKALKLL